MAGLLQIRNVPDETRRVLKARAAAQGTSLNEYLLQLLAEDASMPSVAEVLARARARSERAAVSSVELVRADREARS